MMRSLPEQRIQLELALFTKQREDEMKKEDVDKIMEREPNGEFLVVLAGKDRLTKLPNFHFHSN